MRSGRFLTLGVLVILSAGCANEQTRWENPSVPESQWASDERDCSRSAARKADQDFAGVENRMPNTRGSAGTQITDFDRMEARENRRRLFERCMRSRGYRLVSIADE